MNILDFIEDTNPTNGMTAICERDWSFIANWGGQRRRIREIMGDEAGDTFIKQWTPRVEFVKSILERAKPGLDFYRSKAYIEPMLAELEDKKSNDFFGCGRVDKFVQKGQQLFAYDDTHAYDITPVIWHTTDGDKVHIKFPAYLEEDGVKYIPTAWPDEGSSGGLGCVFYTHDQKRPERSKPIVSFMKCGWIHTRELELSAAEVTQNIINEVMRGETPLTGLHELG